MDFDLIEKLSESELEELYEDIALKDNIACSCHLSARVKLDSTGDTLHSGWFHMVYKVLSCDSPQNSSNEACSAWCFENYPDINGDELIGKRGIVYTTAHGYHRGELYFWYGTMSGYAVNVQCKVPTDAECSGEGWSRSFSNTYRTWIATPRNFQSHCQ